MATVEDPIERASGFAIVGYAVRFPGADDADEFFDPDPDAPPGTVVTRRAGFVDDVTGRDAPFFGSRRARSG
jgi:acyl transferase domain-containing protein